MQWGYVIANFRVTELVLNARLGTESNLLIEQCCY